MNSSTGEKEKVAKVKKVYSNLNDAFGRAEAIYGPLNEWFINDSTKTAQVTRFGERLTEFMKVSKNCSVTTNQICFSRNKKIVSFRQKETSSSSIEVDSSADIYKVILADGSSLAFFQDEDDKSLYGAYLNIDGPNKATPTFGKNSFTFYFSSNNGAFVTDLSGGLTICFNAGLCTDWVLKNENFDYLKADVTGKCPNGKVLDITTNTSCK